MNKKNKYGIIIISVVLLLTILVLSIISIFDFMGLGGGEIPIAININEGAGLSAITDDLKASGVIASKTAFKLYARLSGNHVYQMGEHTVFPSMSYAEIMDELETMPKTNSIKVTIPEGYEIYKIADTLEKEGLINRQVFMRELEVGNFDYDFLRQIPNRQNRLEGYLFPDTYIFSKTSSEYEIIDTMLANFEKLVIPLYEESGTDKSLDDIIKLSSIIEREAANDNERPLVASVFVNRLNKNMRLESCATVQYILKERKPVLSNEDTKIDSPYNTYMYGGLPEGPIASPGLKSIEAALNPAQTDYLYFLANTDGNESLFSETFEEHLQNQRQTQGE